MPPDLKFSGLSLLCSVLKKLSFLLFAVEDDSTGLGAFSSAFSTVGIFLPEMKALAVSEAE